MIDDLKNMNKKVAIYIRVSTDSQAEEGYSIDAQKEQLTAYCISKGLKNYDYYIDGGWSGSNIFRPQLQKLINDIEEEKISHVLVYKLDRLSRSQKDTLYLIEDIFNKYNISFVSLTETIDTGTPMGKLMIGILSAFAQLERENIKMRTRMGMLERVKQGYWMGGGRLPFGYDYDKDLGYLIKNEDSEKVKKIFELYCEGYSAQTLANTFGMKYDNLIYNILTRKTYYGIIEYNNEEYQGKHEPIITKDLFDKAHKCMLERSKVKTCTSLNLLTGLCVCGKCGAKIRYQKWGKAHKLICYSQQPHKQYLVKDPNCSLSKMWAKDIEDNVLQFLFSLNEKEFQSDANNEKKINIVDELEIEYNEKIKKIKKLYNLYATSDDKFLLDTIQELKDEILRLEGEIEKEKELIELKEVTNSTREIVSNLKETWDYMSIKEQQKVIRLLVNKVVVNEDSITIDLKV